MGRGFPASSTIKASGAVRRAVPSRQAEIAPHEGGEEVEGATPFFEPLVRHERG